MPKETEETTIQPPAHLPKHIQAKWSETHAAALRQAKSDFPNAPGLHQSHALRAANAVFRVQEPESYADAARLVEQFKAGGTDGWKILAHGTRTVAGKEYLVIVTVNGKKHRFPIPAAKPAKSDGQKGSKGPEAPTEPQA